MRVELSGQVALVTGAQRGIGQAIADALAENGARVVYSDVDEEGASRAAHGKTGCSSVQLDVADEKSIDAAIDSILADLGRIDILVNNAGVNTLAHRVTIDRFPTSEWDRILRIDLDGVFLTSRKVAAAAMIPQRAGRIINIASIAGIVPLRLQSPFVAAKAGVINLTRSMALELAPHGILVNAIAPGSILTEGTRQLFYGDDGLMHESAQRMLDHVPLGRPGTVREIAAAALFLADPENAYTTGHVLTVDGGWTAGFARDF